MENLFKLVSSFGRFLCVGLLGAATGTSCLQVKFRDRISELDSDLAFSSFSVAVTNGSYTSSTTFSLSYSSAPSSYAEYCILENDTTMANCSWTAGALPASYNVTATENSKVLSFWVRDSLGNVSDRVDSSAVTLDTTTPQLASVDITNASPHNSTTYDLSYGAVTHGSYSQYCILENDTTVGNCSWVNGTLPATYAVDSTEEAKTLSVWIRDSAGNTSTRDDSDTVALRLVAIATAYGLENDLVDDLVLSVQQNKLGSVYYAIYDANQGALTAAQVKTAATGALAGALKARGTVTISTVNVDVDTSVVNLTDNTRYFLYAVGEDGAGLDSNANVRRYTNVLPTKQSMQSYPTAIAGKGGITMRYAIQMPVDYYNDEATSGEWPLLVYMGGGSESFTDPANNESNFNASRGMLNVPLLARVQSGVDDVPMIQATVQCNLSFWNCVGMQDSNMYDEFITQLKNAYRVDAKRVYIVGLSWGGTGTWTFPSSAYASQVAAVVPVAGWATVNTSHLCNGFSGTTGFNSAAYKMPVWAFINSNDPISTDDQNNVDTIANIKACPGYNADARVTVFPTTTYPSTVHGHSTIEYVLNSPFYSFTNSRWEYWNGSASVIDPPPRHRVPLEPTLVSDLATASTELGATLNSMIDWLLLWSRP